MNLYKIKFSHTAPKDTEIGMKGLVLFNSDEEVYNWLKSEPKGMYNSWSDYEETKYDSEKDVFVDKHGYELEYYKIDEDGNPIDFKNKMIEIKGEMNDEDYDFSDAYYGVTLYGWELLKENITTDYSELKELGIILN